jgi:hypothetical protein
MSTWGMKMERKEGLGSDDEEERRASFSDESVSEESTEHVRLGVPVEP